MEQRLVRDELAKCYKSEGVNHYVNCRHLAERMTVHINLTDDRLSLYVEGAQTRHWICVWWIQSNANDKIPGENDSRSIDTDTAQSPENSGWIYKPFLTRRLSVSLLLDHLCQLCPSVYRALNSCYHYIHIKTYASISISACCGSCTWSYLLRVADIKSQSPRHKLAHHSSSWPQQDLLLSYKRLTSS